MIFLQQVEAFVRGDSVSNPHGAIVMFNMCSSMQWAHLPVPGGIYDQDPELLRCWRVIWSKQAEHQKAEDRKREMKQRQASQSSQSPRSAARRRR